MTRMNSACRGPGARPSVVCALLLAVAAVSAVAQVRPPTEAEVQREIARQRSALQEEQLKSDALGMTRGTVLTPPRTGPTITDREIRDAAGDPAELAKLFNEVKRGETHQDAAPVMMFASTSMPRESLAGVPIYIRGLPHGMTGTGLKRSLEALRPYVEAGADLQVHPEMFTYYKVRAVPAVVVTSQPKVGCTDDTCAASYVKVVGDVTLQYALDQVAPRTDEIGQVARKTLARVNKR